MGTSPSFNIYQMTINLITALDADDERIKNIYKNVINLGNISQVDDS